MDKAGCSMNEVEDYIYRHEGEQRAVLLYLDQLFTRTLNLKSRLRYRIPFYDGQSWICYLNPLKKGAVELAFIRGNELSNAQGLLEARGRKQVRGLILDRVSDIPEDLLYEVIQEAILLDEKRPYTGPRKKAGKV